MRRAARLSAASRLLTALQAAQPGVQPGRTVPATAFPAARSSLQAAAGLTTAPWGRSSVVGAAVTTAAARGLTTASSSNDGPLKQFRLAQTGEGIKECELVQWFVAEGDAVEEFGRMCEVQSDKAAIEITSPYAGVVKKLHHKTGDVVQVGEVLADILSSGGAAKPHAPPLNSAARPQLQQQAGHAAGLAAQEEQQSSSSDSSSSEDEAPDRILTSPAVRRLARDHGLALAKVKGSGPGGRVLKGDVLAYLDALSAAAPPTRADTVAAVAPTTAGIPAAATAAPATAAAGAAAGLEPVVVPLRGYRKAMVRSMTIAGTIPHFHFCDEVQMDALVDLRQRLKGDSALPPGTKLTFLPFFIKAAALALREYPVVNASLAPDHSAVVQYRAVHVGMAMATPHGLVVPNVKHAQDKTVVQIAAELARLQAAAAENKLAQADVSGGTFTISNIGTIGGTYATPLVNSPEVAIMAMGRVQRLPRFAADGVTVVPSSVMSISLGADHRVVDGAALANFAQAWRRYVEEPSRWLLRLA